MIGYWGFGMTAAAGLEIAQAAERLAYDSLWTAEAYGSDAATPLAWLAAGTSRIKLGAGLFHNPRGRAALSPVNAATDDNLSHRRLVPGPGPPGAPGFGSMP